MYRLINDIPLLSCRLPEGAFYSFVNISQTIGKSHNGEIISDSVVFAEKLLREKLVAVVPGKAFGEDGFIRLSYACSEEQIHKGLERIAAFCAELT